VNSKVRALRIAPTPGSPLKEAQQTRVRDVMNARVRLVRAETSLDTLVEALEESGQSCIPVVDGVDNLVGVVNREDVFESSSELSKTNPDIDFASRLPGSTTAVPRTAGAVMRTAVTVTETSPVSLAAETLALQRLDGVPVVDSRGQVTGFLALSDIVAWVAGLT